MPAIQPEYLVVSFTALLASGLTLFSGFGLGTLLLPAFMLFFPVPAAVAMTALVHFLNNLFKLALLGREADRQAVLQFGIPAIIAAFFGAWLLMQISETGNLFTYNLVGRNYGITAPKLLVAFLMLAFVLFEGSRLSKTLVVTNRRYLVLGGLLSGFFGGLSGHQGAFRSAFLISSGLSKTAFIATGVVIACLVDISRLSLYAVSLRQLDTSLWPLLATATISAFLGVWCGTRLLKKVTLHWVRKLVTAMLCVTALLLGSGIL